MRSVEEMRNSFCGLDMLLVTPMKDNFDLDLEGVRKNIRFVLDNGVSKEKEKVILTPVAGFGEGVYLSLEEHKKVVKTILDEVDGEVPVYPGIHIAGSLEAEKYCKELQDMGAAGIQLAPPSSYMNPSDDDMVAYYKGIAKAAPKLGFIVYNTHWEWARPATRDMTPDLLGKLLEIPNFVGIKWTSKTLRNFLDGLAEHAGKAAFFNSYGFELSILHHQMGGRGMVVNQVAPWYSLNLWSLLEKRKYIEAWDEIQRWACPWYSLVREIGAEGKHWVSISKGLVEVTGQSAGPPRPPQTRIARAQYKKIEDLVKKSGIMEH